MDWKKVSALVACGALAIVIFASASDLSGRVRTLEEVIRRIDATLFEIRMDLKELRTKK